MSSRKRTPDEPSTETSTAIADPPPASPPVEAKSFAERVGQRKRPTAPDPYGIASDYQAGVHLFESKRDRQMAIKFDNKPPQAILDKMHQARWEWQQADQIWAYPLRAESERTTRIEADRLYQEVRQMLRQEKGIEAGQGVPF